MSARHAQKHAESEIERLPPSAVNGGWVNLTLEMLESLLVLAFEKGRDLGRREEWGEPP